MARKRRSNVHVDTIDDGRCNEALVAQVLGSFNNAPDAEQYRPWTEEDESEIVSRLKDTDRQALKHELICHHVFLAAQFIKKYKNRFYSISTEDLVSNIYWGLVQAAERFDPNKGNRFETFAYWYIRKWVLQPFQTNQWKVSNATTQSFDNTFEGRKGELGEACDADTRSESEILANVDPACVPTMSSDPAKTVMAEEESEGCPSEDDLLSRMRSYALSAAFSEFEHLFYIRKYIDCWTPKDIRRECNLTIGEYRRIDKRISDSLREYMVAQPDAAAARLND